MPSMSDFADDTAFRHSVEETLQGLIDALDDLDTDDFEPRVTPGNLVAIFEESGDTFMLSQQTPTHELWLSANLTAWHFKHHGGEWVERDSGESMLDVLSRLFSEKLGEPVQLRL